MNKVVTTACLFVLLSSAQAAIINVPADQPSIQAGIGAALTGDTVLVAEGDYYERINFLGKAITVASEFINDADEIHIVNTRINGDPDVVGVSDTGSVVLFITGEGPNSVLAGLTITGGTDAPRGGGIYVNSFAGPTISDCTIASNSADLGGGLFVTGTAEISDCNFSQNSADVAGGGFYGLAGEGVLRGCELLSNTAPEGSAVRLEAFQCVIEESQLSGTIRYEDAPPEEVAAAVAGVNIGLAIHRSELFAATIEALYTNVYIDTCLLINCVLIQCCTYGHDLTLITDTLRTCEILAYDNTSIYMSDCSALNSLLSLSAASGYLSETVFQGTISLDWNSNLPLLYGDHCTFAGGGISMERDLTSFSRPIVELTNCIISTNGAPAYTGTGSLRLDCTNIYGYSGENWYVSTHMELDTSFVFFQDPRFCDASADDYFLFDNSPGAPDNNDCGVRLGALEVDCFCCQTRGDLNGNDLVEILDVDNYIEWLFRDGPELFCPESADVDGWDDLSILDIEHLINYLFRDGPLPVPCE